MGGVVWCFRMGDVSIMLRMCMYTLYSGGLCVCPVLTSNCCYDLSVGERCGVLRCVCWVLVGGVLLSVVF